MKKKVLMLILSAAMVLAMMPTMAFAEGATPSEVAQIGTTKYTDLHEALTACKAGETVELLSDVTLSGEWTPVSGFAGTFDGKGYTISGLKITGTADNAGMFTSLDNKLVKNVTITKASVTNSSDSAKYQSILAGQVSSGEISNVTISDSTINSNAKYVGAMFASGYTNCHDCTVSNCTIKGKDQVGGLVGYLWVGGLNKCKSLDNKIEATEERAGGLVGKVQFAAGNVGNSIMFINDCQVKGGSAKAPDFAGGIVAQLMGDCDQYTVRGNSISDFELDAEKMGPVATVRPDNNGLENPEFMAIIATQVTNNTWDELPEDAAVVYTYGPSSSIPVYSKIAAVAQIGDTKYATFKAAVDAVKNDETIEILKDITGVYGMSVNTGKSFTVDFAGHKYTATKPGAGSTETETNMFQLLSGQTITFKNGTLACDADNLIEATAPAKNIKRIIQCYANLTLEDMVIDGTNVYGNGNYIMSFNNDPVVIKGNTSVILKDGATEAFDADGNWDGYKRCEVTVNTSGTVHGNIELGSGYLTVNNVKANGFVLCTECGAEETTGQLDRFNIRGGLYVSDPSAYLHTPFAAAKIKDSKYNYIVGDGAVSNSSDELTAGKYVINPIAYVASGYSVKASGDKTLPYQVYKTDSPKSEVVTEQVTKTEVDKSITDTTEKANAKIVVENTDVTGVAESLTDKGQNEIIKEATANNAQLKQAVNTAKQVNIDISVEAVAKEAPATTTESGQEVITVELTPYAVVTAISSSGATISSEKVLVDNDYLAKNKTKPITVVIGTTFTPQQVLHIHENGEVEAYTEGAEASYANRTYKFETGGVQLEGAKTITLEILDFSEVKILATPAALHTVSFEANGGKGTMDSFTVLDEGSFTLPECGFTAPDGKKFDGWLVNGTKMLVGAEVENVTGDLVVKATWRDSVITADSSNIAIYSIMGMLTLLGIAVVLLKKRVFSR